MVARVANIEIARCVHRETLRLVQLRRRGRSPIAAVRCLIHLAAMCVKVPLMSTLNTEFRPMK